MNPSLLVRQALVFLGSGLGGVARYGVSVLFSRSLPGVFPCWGTFVINVTGCFALGGLMHLIQDRGRLGIYPGLFLTVGLVGGYTTFSSFGYECDLLGRERHPWVELAYAVSSVLVGVAAVAAGRCATRWAAGRADAVPPPGAPQPLGPSGPQPSSEEKAS